MPFFRPPFTINNGDTASAAYLTSMVSVSGYASSASVLIGNATSGASAALQEITLASNLSLSTSGVLDLASTHSVTGTISALHFAAVNAGTSSIALVTLSGGSCSLTGNDVGGKIVMNSATLISTPSGDWVQVVFGTSYTVAPVSVELTPASSSCANSSIAHTPGFWVSAISTTGFIVSSVVPVAGITSGASFSVYYHVL